MKIASHNTMTYLNPQWYLMPFNFIAKCQSKDYKKQLEVTDYLDFRVTYYKGKYVFAHGLIRYNKEVEEVLKDINDNFPGVTIKITNEHNKLKDMFVCFCKHMEEKYPNIKFVGGFNKKDWKVLFRFKNDEPKTIEEHASDNTKSETLLDDIWPWIYAKQFNKKNIEKYKDYNGYLMLDFI